MIPHGHGNKLPPLKIGLERLKIDKLMLYNNIKKEEIESMEIMKALVLCHQAKLFYIPQK
jgi:hypothetical protein